MAPHLLLLALALSAGPEATARHRVAPPPTPAASPAPERPPAEVAAEALALLGAIDTPISAARWRSLGPPARDALEAFARDPSQLPTRRARALDGLAALGAPEDAPRLVALALDEAQPVVVRLAAVRAAGAVAGAGGVGAALRPALEGARDSRVRAAAAQVLARAEPGACPALEARVRQEALEVRGQFEGAARACGWSDEAWR